MHKLEFLQTYQHDNICSIWPFYTDSDGYGIVWIGGKAHSAHRVSFLHHGGVLTADKPNVLHHCDTPACFNPRCLHAGSQKDNARDMVNRGRANKRKGEDHPSSKLTEADVFRIRQLLVDGWIQQDIANEYGVTQVHVSQIKLRKSWAHL